MRLVPPVKREGHLQKISPQDLSRCSTEAARAYVPYGTAGELSCLPLGFLEQYGTKILTIATATRSVELSQKLKFITGCEVRLVEVDSEALIRAIFISYNGSERNITAASDKVLKGDVENKVDGKKLFGLRECDTAENELLCAIIDYAISVDASDIHLIPKEKGGFVQLRVGNEFYSRETRMCAHASYRKIIQRIKVLSKLDITKHEMPQDGSFEIPLLSGKISARVSVMPVHFGEKIVLRLMHREESLSLDLLCYPPEVIACIKDTIHAASGLTLFCGATGSGKTTALYAVMEAISKGNESIVSIEDPIESVFDWMDQTAVSERNGLGFSEALRALLRQDPDVIMVGEIRDAVTAQTALKASMTGHRIFSSLHAGDISKALLRLESFGIEHSVLRSTVNLIVHQDLVPRLCQSCRVLDLPGHKKLGAATYRADGCATCSGTGTLGRVPVVQMFRFSKCNAARKGEISMSEGDYFPRRSSLRYLVTQGLISYPQFEILSEE